MVTIKGNELMTDTSIAERLTALRRLMDERGLDYYFIPSSDAHHNEYVPACWQRRAWISGFTGSAGSVLVGRDQAYLWTDPRYFLQAEQELDADLFVLMRQQPGMASPVDDWLAQQGAQQIGVDPRLMTVGQMHRWAEKLDAVDSQLVALDENLVDAIWDDRATMQCHPLQLHAIEYSGLSAIEKIAALRVKLSGLGVDAHVVTMLDAICWLFNIRGQDIAFNPLVMSYAIITQDKAMLFVDVGVLSAAQRQYFEAQAVLILPYESFAQALNQLQGSVLLDTQTASSWVEHQLPQAVIKAARSPISLMKACKNPVEQQGAVEAHRRDALAVIRFWIWLEQNWQGQTEASVAQMLDGLRAEDPHCRGLSFPTISGFGPHGAIIHYSVNPKTDSPLDDQSLLLVDSGGQYDFGTTDVTRVFHLGRPTHEQRSHYTRVLKGHLALRHTVFPLGTTGEQLNAIAHRPLWQAFLDFGHGTGHGVGSYLCVHEGPQCISSGITGVALLPGMIVSNEPGVYIEGQHGVRIENLCLIKEVADVTQSLSGHGPFYGFEDLTLIPYARDLMDLDALSAEEKRWVNDYHQKVYDQLSSDLSDEARHWLKIKTEPL